MRVQGRKGPGPAECRELAPRTESCGLRAGVSHRQTRNLSKTKSSSVVPEAPFGLGTEAA